MELTTRSKPASANGSFSRSHCRVEMFKIPTAALFLLNISNMPEEESTAVIDPM
jgi:hypothetical protein